MLAVNRPPRTRLLFIVMAPPEYVDSDRRAGRQGGRLAQLSEPGLHRLVVGLVRGSEHEPGPGPVRDDVRGGPALLDDPVDAGRRAELLPPQPDRAEQQDHRVERVLAPPRIGRRVGLEAREHDLDVLGGQRPAVDVGPIAGVVQQGGVEAVEQAVLDHRLLAAAAFLGRAAEEDDLARQLVGDRRQGDRRADARRGHRVVAAAVAEPRQGVVLGEDADPRARRRHDRPAARPGSPSRGCRPDAGPRSRGASGPRRPSAAAWCSSKAGSGIGMDPMRQLEDLGAGGLDGGGEARLGLDVGLGRGGRWSARTRVLRDGSARRRWAACRQGSGWPAAVTPTGPSVPRTGSPRPRRPARS